MWHLRCVEQGQSNVTGSYIHIAHITILTDYQAHMPAPSSCRASCHEHARSTLHVEICKMTHSEHTQALCKTHFAETQGKRACRHMHLASKPLCDMPLAVCCSTQLKAALALPNSQINFHAGIAWSSRYADAQRQTRNKQMDVCNASHPTQTSSIACGCQGSRDEATHDLLDEGSRT